MTLRIVFTAILAGGLLFATHSRAQYNQATTGLFANGTNPIEKSATASPNDFGSFSNAVWTAHQANRGGVFDLPTSITSGTTAFRGTYGVDRTKRLTITSQYGMQGLGTGGTLSIISGTVATSTSSDRSSYNLAIGPITDATTDVELLSEAVSQIGLVILARTHATYPLDIRLTAFYSDGTTESATANVGNPKNSDDTFYGFTAPEGESITNLLLDGFATGTTTPVSTRLGFDDFGFITAPTGILPPPQLAEIHPANGAVHWASNGLHFEARSQAPIDSEGISVVLNTVDVSSQLAVTGEPTNRFVSFDGLLPNLKYSVEITVSNVAGITSQTNIFYTPEDPVVIFDSGGFADDILYPVGPLQPVTHDDSRWVPATEAAEVVDVADGEHGKVIRRRQTGEDQVDHLLFPPVASGVVMIEFDARASSLEGRVIDMSLNAVTANGGGTQGPFIMWATNALQYYNGTAWVPQVALDTGWHHFELICYVSGPLAGTFDLEVDGAIAGEGLFWRNTFSPVGTLRIGAIRGTVDEFGDVDNLVLRVAPEPLVALPVTLLRPVHTGAAFSFSFQSLAGLSHTVEFKSDLGTTTWTPLETIAGDGTEKTVTHADPPAGPLFYRVSSQVPAQP